jgi:hypothetical protein
MQVEISKTVEARDGTLVQSQGERRIADLGRAGSGQTARIENTLPS